MPSTYAHLRFGNEVVEKLDASARSICMKYRDLYNIGLHGPDILFYYDILDRGPVSGYGMRIHSTPARDFFTPAKEVVGRYGEMARAYMYGFICHFALDGEAHPYIEDYVLNRGVEHTGIEGDFDRFLLDRDGKNPERTYLAGHIRSDRRGCEVISAFFEGITPEQIEESLARMRKYNKVLLAPGRVKRHLVLRYMRKKNCYDDMHGLIIQNRPDDRCVDSCNELMRIYDSSMDLAVDLARELDEYLDGKVPALSPRFDKTFSV